MDRNTIIGLLLIGAIMLGYGILTQPSAEEIQQQRHIQDSIAQVRKEDERRKAALQPETPVTTAADTPAADSLTAAQADSLHRVQMVEKFSVFASAVQGTEELLSLENEKIKLTVSTHGGKVKSILLKDYKRYNQSPLLLLDGKRDTLGVSFFVQNRKISCNDLYFTPVGKSVSVQGNRKGSLAMRLYAGDSSRYVEYTYTLTGNSYDVAYDVRLVGMQHLIPDNSNYINLEWKAYLPQQEKSIESERANSTVFYKYNEEDPEKLAETEDERESLTSRVKWVAFKQQFFTAALIAETTFDKPSEVETVQAQEHDPHVKKLVANLTIPYNHKPDEHFAMRFYFGPNHYNTLKQYDLDLEKQIPLGWGIFGIVNKAIVIPLFNFLSGFDITYGIVILLLTIIIKVVLLPLTYRAYLSGAKMRILKPDIDEINEKYKKNPDPLKMQQETMALYKKAGVNPLGGCFPMLLQLPILIALFNFFPASIELRQESFLWAEDLSTYDSILDLGFNIPFYGDHVSLFAILMSVSTILYTMLNSQMTANSAQMAQMKWVMYLMPVIFLGVFNSSSAGLSYYYFLANVISIGQQYLFQGFVNEKEIHRKIQENKRKPGTPKKSKFQQRLEEMAKARGYKPPK